MVATMTHSWFVKFDKDFNSQLPLWFICWWTQFDLITDIFPGPLIGSLKCFISVFKTNAYRAKFLATLQLVKKIQVALDHEMAICLLMLTLARRPNSRKKSNNMGGGELVN